MFLLLAFLLNAWQWHDGKTFQIKTSLSLDGQEVQEWIIPSPAPMNLHPQVALDREGNGIIVWDGAVEKGYAVFVSHFDGQSRTWSEPWQLSALSRTFLYPQVVMQDDFILVLWEQLTTASKAIYSSHVYLGGDWRPPTPISNAEGMAIQPQLLLSPIGGAMAIWVQAKAQSMEVRAAFFSKEGWIEEKILSEARAPLSTPQLSLREDGCILATWKCKQEAQAALFDFSTSEWSAPFEVK